MKKLFFETEKDGFYGTYYENPKGADCAVIGLFGDDPNDYMAKCGAKWLHKNGVNVLCTSPGKKNYSHVNYPLERIEIAIKWLKNNGNRHQVAEEQWQSRNRYYGNEHGRHGRDCGGFLLPGHYTDLWTDSQ